MKSKQKPFDGKRSYQDMIYYIMQFCVPVFYEQDTKAYGATRGFVKGTPVVGDLVLVTCAPKHPCVFGWLLEIEELPGDTRYLVKSAEDGSFCNWTNVDIRYFDREKVIDKWKWNDRQWEFNDRWMRVCYREKDACIRVPLTAKFGSGYEVSLGIRTRFGLDDRTPSKSFHDWRKVTKKMMGECYDELCEKAKDKTVWQDLANGLQAATEKAIGAK